MLYLQSARYSESFSKYKLGQKSSLPDNGPRRYRLKNMHKIEIGLNIVKYLKLSCLCADFVFLKLALAH